MTTFQLKRGTQAQHDNYIGDPGELTAISDDDYRPVVHDGVTSGGFPVAFEGESGGGGSPTQQFLRDFETGDLSNWSSGGGYSVVSSPSLSGTYSMHFDGQGTTSELTTTFPADTYQEFRFELRVEAFDGQTTRPQARIHSGSTKGLLIGTDTSGEVVTYNGTSYIGTGVTLSTATKYEIRVQNIDYGGNTFDVEVFDSGGTSLGSSSGHAFWNSISQADEFRFYSEDQVFYGDDVSGWA